MLSGLEVAKHSTRQSCWVIIKGEAYDVTDFLDSHPGGPAIILKYGGKDATAEYEPIHPAGTIEKALSKDKHLALVDPTTMATPSEPQKMRDLSKEPTIPISLCMNLFDIEAAAEKVISRRAWTYFHSAADGLHSYRNNLGDWEKVTLRPRVLRNVARANMERTIMGQKSSLPFFIAPAALAKLAHEDGELCLARGAVRFNVPYCTSTYSSVSHEELAKCMREERKGGCLLFQLYVAKVKDQTLQLVKMARDLGFKALVITVDTPVVGKREEDEKYKAELEYETGKAAQLATQLIRSRDTSADIDGPVLRGFHSYTLNWDDLKWIREAWGNTGPVVLKGIQTPEDAKLAYEMGIDGIYLSNHGGRQIDSGPSSIRTLLEIHRFCPEILGKIEIYMDGGFRRGADILKALALGATAIAMGRPFMYALGAYGTDGVLRAMQILSDEIETTMRLLGVTELSQLEPDMVNCTILEQELPRKLRYFESAKGWRGRRRSKL